MAFCCSASVYVPSPLPNRASARRSRRQFTGPVLPLQLPQPVSVIEPPAANAPLLAASLARAADSELVTTLWKSGFEVVFVSAYWLYTLLIFKRLRKSAKMVQSRPFARTPLVTRKSSTLVQGRLWLCTAPEGCENPKFGSGATVPTPKLSNGVYGSPLIIRNSATAPISRRTLRQPSDAQSAGTERRADAETASVVALVLVSRLAATQTPQPGGGRTVSALSYSRLESPAESAPATARPNAWLTPTSTPCTDPSRVRVSTLMGSCTPGLVGSVKTFRTK